MVAVNLHFDRADMMAFRDQMDRLIKELGKAPEDAVRMGCIALLKALRTRTRTAPQRLRVTESRSASAAGRNVKSRTIYKVRRYRGGERVTRSIFANSLQEARNSPAARLDYAGLAKQSWGWVMQRLFPNQRAPSARFKEPREILSTIKRGTGNDYTIEIENKLDYINRAFRTSGKMAVSGAMAAAAQTMKGRIDQRLKGKIK